MTNAETYRRQLIFQKKIIVSMVIVLIYGMSEIAIQEKAEEKNLQITGISSIEDTHLSDKKRKLFVVTSKVFKSQVKIEVDRILRGMTLQINTPKYKKQPGTIKREHCNYNLTKI